VVQLDRSSHHARIAGVTLWELQSARRILRFFAPDDLDMLWQSLAPRLPAVNPEIPPRRLGNERHYQAAARIPGQVEVADIRRWLNAYIHCLHLNYDTLTLHGVALEHAGQTVLLTGANGAGKSLVGLALARQGWKVLAGDATLVDLLNDGDPAPGSFPALLGGRRIFMAQNAETLRCFPDVLRALRNNCTFHQRLGRFKDLLHELGPGSLGFSSQVPINEQTIYLGIRT